MSPHEASNRVHLSHLNLTNFRNFLRLDMELPAGVVVISGRNAQGKSSLLEAIYLLAIARSSRAENDIELVCWPAAVSGGGAFVSGTIERREDRLRVHIGYQCVPMPPETARQANRPPYGVRREIRVDRVRRTASELVGVVNAVLFTAEDIQLVQGPPSLRRRYLDILLSQTHPLYLRSLQRYLRVIQQRNRLLRALQDRRAEEKELVFWDQEMVKEGAAIMSARYSAMLELSALCRESHRELSGAEEGLSIEYSPNVPVDGRARAPEELEQALALSLEASAGRDRASGSTAVGPHRDDFGMSLDGVDMGTFASRGQARTIALAMRLAEAAYLHSARGEAPIVLLDDVLSELDTTRRFRVLSKVVQYQQVIITTTEPLEHVAADGAWGTAGAVLSTASFFRVEGGMIYPIHHVGPRGGAEGDAL